MDEPESQYVMGWNRKHRASVLERKRAQMATTIYQVNQWYSPHVGHGFEPVAHFSDRAVAERYAAHCTAEAIEKDIRYMGDVYTYDVDEITVDDPAALARLDT